MESEIYYMNFRNEYTKGTPPPPPTPSRPQDVGKDQKCRVSRCSVVIAVCSGLICVLLQLFIILEHISVTAERESMSKNHNDTVQALYQMISRLQADYSDLMSEKMQLQDRCDELKYTYQRGYFRVGSQMTSGLQDTFNAQKNEVKDSYQKGYQWGSGWFFKSSVSMTWSESRQYCRDKGADLVIINSEAKQNFITSIIAGNERVWIGLTDILEEGKMKWVDNTPLKQGFWAAGEPNEPIYGNEDCVELVPFFPPMNNWNDLPCSQIRKAICEK